MMSKYISAFVISDSGGGMGREGAREALPEEVKYYCVGRINVVRSRQGALCKRNISDWKRSREERELPSLWLCFVRLHIQTGFIAASGVWHCGTVLSSQPLWRSCACGMLRMTFDL